MKAPGVLESAIKTRSVVESCTGPFTKHILVLQDDRNWPTAIPTQGFLCRYRHPIKRLVNNFSLCYQHRGSRYRLGTPWKDLNSLFPCRSSLKVSMDFLRVFHRRYGHLRGRLFLA